MAVTFNQTADGKWTLDVRGYACPQPQMYTKKALQKLLLQTLLFMPTANRSIATAER